MAACARCGEENTEGARFCSSCGAALQAEAALDREVRKTVTVVFTDVVGSTTLGARRDPEAIRRIMSRYFQEARDVLERHGGTVEKFIGDAVMAVFGIPTLHEDDALRAVRAASELRSRLLELNEELKRDWGARIEVRTGVNTGEVVAGSAAEAQAFAVGDAVNVAKRFEEAAQAGEVLLGEDTYRLVRDAVDVEPVENVVLKGKSEAVTAYRLLGVGEELRGTARRLDAPMVGREHERRLLEDAYARVVREQGCHLFTLLGPAGVGKSRLAAEVVDLVREDATVLVGRCLPYGEGITFWPVVEILRQAAGLREGDRPTGARVKIDALLAGAEGATVIGERVAHAVGLPAAVASAEETFWAVRKLLEALAGRRPLVVVFDDIHWAEPTFLDLVEHVADWASEAPILLLCLARPELLDQRPGWGGGKLNATSILLEPLSDEECELLIENLLGRADLPEAARERITSAAEGNPLFVEEMLGMLIDDGLLHREEERWVAADDLSCVAVPPTIQALLAARLDRLERAERAVLELASVEGKVFHRGSVHELAPEVLRADLLTHLLTLQRKELIRPGRSDFAGEDAFRFRHVLICDAAYEAIPKQARAELHEHFADWLERTAGEHAQEYEEILGYHFEQAHRYRIELGPGDAHTSDLARQAGKRLARAARRARDRYDLTASRNLFERAIAVYPEGDRARLESLPDLGEVLALAGDYAAAETVLSDAIEGAEATGDQGEAAHARVVLTGMRLFSRAEEGDEALRVSRDATGVFQQLGDDRGVALTARNLVWVLVGRGQLTAARGMLTAALPHAERAGDLQLEVGIRLAIVSSFFWDDTPLEEVEGHCEDHLGWVREQGLPSAEEQALRWLGILRAMQGEIDEGRELIDRAAQIAAELGPDVPARAMNHAWIMGQLELLAGDPSAAEQVQREGYEILDRLGEKGMRSTLAGQLAESIYRQGRYEDAAEVARAGLEAAALDDVTSQSSCRVVEAKVLARRGELEEAERLAREAVRMIGETEFLEPHAWALTGLAEVLGLAGRPEDATEPLREALELYEQKGNVIMAGRTRELIAEFAAA